MREGVTRRFLEPSRNIPRELLLGLVELRPDLVTLAKLEHLVPG